MTPENLHTYLPTPHQKIAAAILAAVAVLWIFRLLKRGVLREEHALLWLVCLALLSLAIFVDPILITISKALGTVVPASALLLLGLFALSIICIWMTCIISRHERRIALLTIELAMQRLAIEQQQKRKNV